MRKILVINHQFPEEFIQPVREAADRLGFSVTFRSRGREAMDDAPDAEIIFGFCKNVLPAAKAVRWVCLPSAGVDQYIGNNVVPEGVLLTHSSGTYGVTLSEYMIMMTLMLLRRQKHFGDQMAQRIWAPPTAQNTIRDSRVTVLGAGDIGRHYARLVQAFGPASVTAVSRSGKSDEPAFDKVLPVSELDSILPQTDILAMSLPSTPETEDILNAERIALLPHSAVLVNAGRGTAIDEAALIAALNEDRLAGAALDVMRHEPLDPDDPLWTAKNCILTPHVGGNLTTPYTIRKNLDMFIEDLENYAAGRPLRYTVNRERGY